jgi:putative transposase
MSEYRHGAHAVFDLKYQVVWITKYRHKVLRGISRSGRAR